VERLRVRLWTHGRPVRLDPMEPGEAPPEPA